MAHDFDERLHDLAESVAKKKAAQERPRRPAHSPRWGKAKRRTSMELKLSSFPAASQFSIKVPVMIRGDFQPVKIFMAAAKFQLPRCANLSA
jgi:hypothetical protein